MLFSSPLSLLLSCKGVFIVVSLTVDTVVARPRCQFDQITVQAPNGTFCRDCPRCKVGLGLSPQCGSYVKPGIEIRCEPCEAGVSYSDVEDLLACKSCAICDPNSETLRVCTPTQNSICGHCLKGFYREVTGDCKPCSTCCGHRDDRIMDECTNQGLPTKHSCRYDLDTIRCARMANTSTNSKTDTRTNLTPSPAQGRLANPVIPNVYGIIAVIAVLALCSCGTFILYCVVRPRWRRDAPERIQMTQKQPMEPATQLHLTPPGPMSAGAHDSTIKLVTGAE